MNVKLQLTRSPPILLGGDVVAWVLIWIVNVGMFIIMSTILQSYGLLPSHWNCLGRVDLGTSPYTSLVSVVSEACF